MLKAYSLQLIWHISLNEDNFQNYKTFLDSFKYHNSLDYAKISVYTSLICQQIKPRRRKAPKQKCKTVPEKRKRNLHKWLELLIVGIARRRWRQEHFRLAQVEIGASPPSMASSIALCLLGVGSALLIPLGAFRYKSIRQLK